MELTLKRFARLAALGALAVSGGAFGLYALLAYGSRHSNGSGIDQTQALIAWIALAVPFAAIIAAHVVFARILFRYARDD